jgi:hypothetical protein
VPTASEIANFNLSSGRSVPLTLLVITLFCAILCFLAISVVALFFNLVESNFI